MGEVRKVGGVADSLVNYVTKNTAWANHGVLAVHQRLEHFSSP
jgi:hypothetical protein